MRPVVIPPEIETQIERNIAAGRWTQLDEGEKAFDPSEHPRGPHGRFVRSGGGGGGGGGADESLRSRLASLGIEYLPPAPSGISDWTSEEYEAASAAIGQMMNDYPRLRAQGAIKRVTTSSNADTPFQISMHLAMTNSLAAYSFGDKTLYLNDLWRDDSLPFADHLTPASRSYRGAITHEMGHALANTTSMDTTPRPGEGSEYRLRLAAEHQKFMAQYGISFPEVARLGQYAASSASEGFAELTSAYNVPGYRQDMDPGLRAKADKLFGDLKS